MKTIVNLFAIVCLGVIGTSCLKDDLGGSFNSSLAEMTDFRLHFKWQDTTVDKQRTNEEFTRITIKVVQMNYTKKVDAAARTLQITPSFPSDFPIKYKRKASLTYLWGVAYISSAATIAPLNGSPRLGTPGDYSKPVSYEITAANGNKKTWTITVDPLPVVNKYDGMYQASGTGTGPPEQFKIDQEKYLNTVDANTVSGPHSNLGKDGYTYRIKVNADNTCVVTQYDKKGTLIGEMTPNEVNMYYPNEKKFVLHYRYNSPAWKTISETLVLK